MSRDWVLVDESLVPSVEGATGGTPPSLLEAARSQEKKV
jgi:hypothetical protein